MSAAELAAVAVTAAAALLPVAPAAFAAGALVLFTAKGDVDSFAVREVAARIGGKGRREISHTLTLAPTNGAREFLAKRRSEN